MAYIGPAPADSIIATSDIEDGAVTSAKIAASVAIAKGGTGTTTAAAAFTALASSQATVGDGSAGAPAITSSTASADSGIYFPAADTIGMVSGGTEQFRFGSNPIPGGNKNLIHNGNMTIAQRGSTVTSPANGAYTLDGWKHWKTGGNDVNVIQDDGGIFTAGGSEFSMRIDCTTVESSVAADDRLVVVAPVEAQDLQHLEWGQASAKPVTVSFGFRSPKSGTHYVALYQTDGDRYCWRAFTVASADTAEFFKITFAADASGRIDNNNGVGLFLYFPLMAGSNFESGSDNTWASGEKYAAATLPNLLDNTSNRIYIGKVQLEVGSVATDFEFEDYGTTLEKAYRYYQRWNITIAYGAIASGHNAGTTVSRYILPTRVTMRAAPTLEVSGVADFAVQDATGSKDTTNVTLGNSYPEVVRIDAVPASSQTVSLATLFMSDNSTARWLALSAEL